MGLEKRIPRSDNEISRCSFHQNWFCHADLADFQACLYGLMRDELRYILDPEEAQGRFPRRTFRVLKEKDTWQFGRLRARRFASVTKG